MGEPGHEPRAVKIRVDLELKIDLRPFRHEAQRVVERRAVSHHRAEDHLVVAALGAAEPAGHPRVDEDRDAFVDTSAARRHAARSGRNRESIPDARPPARPYRRTGAGSADRAPPDWSIVATWTSSWFMIVFIRSFVAMVSKM